MFGICNLYVYITCEENTTLMNGWIALSMTWVELTVESLRARLDALFPGEFLPPRDRGTFVIDGPIERMQFAIHSAIKSAEGMFMLNSVPGPYSDVCDFAERIEYNELRDLALAQEAWLSVELIGQTLSVENACSFAGKVLAELAPQDTAVVLNLSGLTCRHFDEEIRRKLANGSLTN